MPDEDKIPGLVPPGAVIDAALALAKEIEAERLLRLEAEVARIPELEADAASMRDIRAGFEALSGGKCATDMTRPEIVAMLKGVAEAMSSAVAIPIGRNVAVEHPCVGFLVELAGIISDLQNGKTHPSLKLYSHGATASLTAKESYKRKVLVEAVLILKLGFNYKTWIEAANHLVAGMKSAGGTIGVKPPTVNRLKSISFREKFK
ncbi:hypothetical protein [Bosea sp. NBC_00550]|uniref:hypothetical protein n=1 Tax=Bosea sp. NBC_00550 TaxID=2969621 RepID=UPI0022302BB1|nr:hypothetical protein [Bosea sp. NBC_00550]UZF92076.1 hypothetical protein NWE53_23810 [Bosea sp. NBC_00550]